MCITEFANVIQSDDLFVKRTKREVKKQRLVIQKPPAKREAKKKNKLTNCIFETFCSRCFMNRGWHWGSRNDSLLISNPEFSKLVPKSQTRIPYFSKSMPNPELFKLNPNSDPNADFFKLNPNPEFRDRDLIEIVGICIPNAHLCL